MWKKSENGSFIVNNQFDESKNLSHADEINLEKDEMNKDELLRLGYVLDKGEYLRLEEETQTQIELAEEQKAS